jgi:hypothetical protein
MERQGANWQFALQKSAARLPGQMGFIVGPAQAGGNRQFVGVCAQNG